MSDPRKCSRCGGRGRVRDSRPRAKIANPANPGDRRTVIEMRAIRRRLHCTKCEHRWTTYEVHRNDLAALSPDARIVFVQRLADAAASILAAISALEEQEKP